MNRRTFFFGAAAGTALIGNSALAQRRSRDTTILTSELTGGKIDISGTDLVVAQQHIDDADGSEHIHFEVEGGQFDLIFWPHTSGNAADFVTNAASMYSAVFPDTEDLGSDSYEDGGWLAFDAGVIGYFEYQLEAYGDHDLIVALVSPRDTFQDKFDQAQLILLDGMSPFLFHEESEIQAIAEERASVATSGTSRTSRGSTTSDESKVSRSSRSSTSHDDEEGETNTRSRSSSNRGDDPVDAVVSHRATFLENYDQFYAFLQVAADETATDREVEDAFAAMLNIAFAWQEYPAQAARIEFTANLANLETVYLNWADAIGEMGFLFEDFYMGQATVDDYLAAQDAWSLIDDDLIAILETLSGVFRPQVRNHRAARANFARLEAAA